MRSRHVADQWFGVRFHHVIHSTLVRWKVKRVASTQQLGVVEFGILI